ncbi:zinc finger MIZ domain-containing protein 1 [Caerostris darwini]|uniref:Zinc finger MIZ domain-containing protein 1 n=1 Tax=Caerostris darwini TaxID=1538125 RepID=A0AAV4QQS8_9ARAC|nr:zinc finger MIZ domain-containing protein 1 [Caerostris darwini]
MLSAVKEEPIDESGGAGGSSTDEPPVMDEAIERHIRQTNDRLHCIREALATQTSYQTAARELLEWCGDFRAFQKWFEELLFGCLTVISQVSHKPGYDLDLGYRILAVCAAQRERFSPKSASIIYSRKGMGFLLKLTSAARMNSVLVAKQPKEFCKSLGRCHGDPNFRY